MTPAGTRRRKGVNRKPGLKHRLQRLQRLCDFKSVLLLSIDVGTSGVRAALFDERGAETVSTQTRRRSVLSHLGEFDPDALVEEVIATIDELFSLTGAGAIEFIAIS